MLYEGFPMALVTEQVRPTAASWLIPLAARASLVPFRAVALPAPLRVRWVDVGDATDTDTVAPCRFQAGGIASTGKWTGVDAAGEHSCSPPPPPSILLHEYYLLLEWSRSAPPAGPCRLVSHMCAGAGAIGRILDVPPSGEPPQAAFGAALCCRRQSRKNQRWLRLLPVLTVPSAACCGVWRCRHPRTLPDHHGLRARRRHGVGAVRRRRRGAGV